MPNNFLNPAFAATQKKFAVPRVTGQYEQLPQNGGSGMRQGAWAPWKNPTPGTVSYGYAPGSVPQKYEARLPANMLTQGPATDFDTSGTDPATIEARKRRAAASPGLAFNPFTEQNSGRWDFSDVPNPQNGINLNAMVQANPNAARGLSDASRAKLNPLAQNAMASDLKARQLAYQQRQAGAEQNMLARQQMVMQNAMARGDARRGRIEARQQGPNFFDQMMQQDPETALAAMRMQQQGFLAQQGLGLQQQQINNEFAVGQGKNKVLGDQALADREKWGAEQQNQMAAVWATEAQRIKAENPTYTDQQAMDAAKRLYPGAGFGQNQGPQNVMAGMPGAPAQQQDALPDDATVAKFKGDPSALVQAWLKAGMTKEQVNKKLAELYQGDLIPRTRTADNPSGGGWGEVGVDSATGAEYPTNFLAPLFDAFTGANQSEYDYVDDPTPEAPKRRLGTLRKAGRANWLDRLMGAPVVPPKQVYTRATPGKMGTSY